MPGQPARIVAAETSSELSGLGIETSGRHVQSRPSQVNPPRRPSNLWPISGCVMEEKVTDLSLTQDDAQSGMTQKS